MPKKKTALITGITGQDGSYLSEFLLSKGYDIHGIIRRSSALNAERVRVSYPTLQEQDASAYHLHYGDLSDPGNLTRILEEVQPDEIYNLGAQSHVRISFDVPLYTADVTGLGTLRLLEAIRASGISTKFYQASSSEMFGRAREIPQNEKTPFYPRSPYAVAKALAYWTTVNYREAYGIFASNGILFNHESPRRGENFVTRKITTGIAEMLAGKRKTLYLGNLDAKRDWGYAPEYCEAMWNILQQSAPDDYVIATGESHSVREFVEAACALAGIPLRWEGAGIDEKGINRKTGEAVIAIDKRYFRPTEVDVLVGDASKAREKLGWKPRVAFGELVRIMLEADSARVGVKLPPAHTA